MVIKETPIDPTDSRRGLFFCLDLLFFNGEVGDIEHVVDVTGARLGVVAVSFGQLARIDLRWKSAILCRRQNRVERE
jgi:hypothetical protein